MDEHPGIVFRGGPDVWELMFTLGTALRYYAALPDEIDRRITLNLAATARLEFEYAIGCDLATDGSPRTCVDRR